MAQERYFLQPKLAFAELSIKLMLTQARQHYTQMLCMLLLIAKIYQDIIDEDHHKLVQFGHEHRIHEIHEMSRCICETEGHDEILIEPIPHRESSLRYIFRTDLDLMIPKSQINLGEYLGFRQLVKQDINVRKRVLILDGHRIQGAIVHAHA